MGAEVQGQGNTSVWRAALDGLAEILSSLVDVQLQTIVTTKMAPAIYVLSCGGVIGINVWLTANAFQQSLSFGLVWACAVMPVMVVAGLVIVRVSLEVILSIFRLVVNMELMMEQLQTLRGQTETIVGRTDEIVEDLPRIQFWRSRKRYRGNESEDGDAR
jgi:hypothetical protein